MFVQGEFFRYEVEMERHEKTTKCPDCDENTKPELPYIRFQIGLVPSDQIKAEKVVGLQRKSQTGSQWAEIHGIIPFPD